MEYKTPMFLLLVLLSGFQVCYGSVISDTIVLLERAVESYMNTTLVTAREVARRVEEQVVEVIQRAEVSLEAAIRGAMHRAAVVLQCSSEVGSALANIRQTSRADLRACVLPSTEGIKVVVHEFQDDLQEINQAVAVAFHNFSSCGFNLTCEIRALQESYSRNSEIRFNIANHVVDLQRAVLLARRNGTLCAQKVMSYASKEIQGVAEQATACVSSSSSSLRPR